MKTTVAPIPFAGSMLGSYRHVCAFFSSPQEEYGTLLPFVRDGLERGERAFHIFPSQYREEHLEQLRSGGIDVVAAQRRRQLEVATPQETYLRGGRFDKNAMLALIQETLKTGTTLGFALTRLVAHAESVLEDWANVNDWIEYETRVNEVLPRYSDPVICTYDTNLLNGAIAWIFCAPTPSPSSAACYTRTHSSSRRRSYCARSCNAAASDPRHTGDDAGRHAVRSVSAWHGVVGTADGLTLGR